MSLADALRRAGFRTGHEEFYGLDRKPQEGIAVSWMVVPFLDRPCIHLWRDPVATVASMLRMNFPLGASPKSEWAQRQMRAFGNPLSQDPEQAAWQFWIEWSRRIRKWAFLTVTIDDLSALEDHLGVRLHPRRLNGS